MSGQKLGLLQRMRRAFGLSTLLGGNYVGEARGAHLMGTDLAGNKYWELPNVHGDLRATATRRFVEYAKPGTWQDHAMRDEKIVPVQWILWLRHTRMDAPSLEELRRDVERIRITRHNARVLELKRALEIQAAEEERNASHVAAVEDEQAKRKAAQEAVAAPASTPTTGKKPGRRRAAAAVPTAEVTAEGVPDAGVAPAVISAGARPASVTSDTSRGQAPVSSSSPSHQPSSHSTPPSQTPPAAQDPPRKDNLSDELVATLDPKIAEAVAQRAQRRQAAMEADLVQADPVAKAQAELARARQEVHKSVLQDFEIDWTDGTGSKREC